MYVYEYTLYNQYYTHNIFIIQKNSDDKVIKKFKFTIDKSNKHF